MSCQAGYHTKLIRRVLWRPMVAMLAVAAFLLAGAVSSASADSNGPTPRECGDNFPATRDPANPLMLPNPPGSNPLNGAQFYVNGPRHGPAAGYIADLLGLDHTKLSDSYSWAQFKHDFEQGWLHSRTVLNPVLTWKIHELEKIAEQPEQARFSLYSGGGGPGAIAYQVKKIFCYNMQADPDKIPVFNTYFIYQHGYCESRDQILSAAPTFRRQVDELAHGIDRRPAVVLLELDAVATSNCVGPGGLGPWEDDLRYEINKISALPHTVVYVEGGYADDQGPRPTARVLNAIGVRKIRGFFTNDTHNDWTINEIRWGNAVSRMTHGAHFIINTPGNGRGPFYNLHPVTEGIELLCNPPGRGLGPPPTTHTGFKNVDAFTWIGVPGGSSGCPGSPPATTFMPDYALGMALRAQAKLGPGWPNNPY